MSNIKKKSHTTAWGPMSTPNITPQLILHINPLKCSWYYICIHEEGMHLICHCAIIQYNPFIKIHKIVHISKPLVKAKPHVPCILVACIGGSTILDAIPYHHLIYSEIIPSVLQQSLISSIKYLVFPNLVMLWIWAIRDDRVIINTLQSFVSTLKMISACDIANDT